jgi:hypothetical protein
MPIVFIHKLAETIRTSSARKNKTISALIILALLFNLAAWLLLIAKFNQILTPGTKTVPLHYNIHLGIDLQGAWWHSLYMPMAGLIFLTINHLLTLSLFHKKNILGYFLSATNLFLQIIILSASVFTLLLNV